MSSTKEGGLFGHPRAFFMAIEEQGRLSLHDHILIWLHGHDKMRMRLQQPGGVDEMQKYLDAAITNYLPVPKEREHEMMTCHSRTGCTASLGPHPSNFREAHKYNHHMGDDPLILQCKPEAELNEDGSAATKHTYSADAVADRVLERWWNRSRPGVVMPTTPEEIAALKWGGQAQRPSGTHRPADLCADSADVLAQGVAHDDLQEVHQGQEDPYLSCSAAR
jgi:hypothetical protein